MFLDKFDKSDLEFLKDTKHYQAIESIDKLVELHRQQEILHKKIQFALLLKALHVEGYKWAYIVTTKSYVTMGKDHVDKSKLFTDKDEAFKFQQMTYSRRTIQSYDLEKYAK